MREADIEQPHARAHRQAGQRIARYPVGLLQDQDFIDADRIEAQRDAGHQVALELMRGRARARSEAPHVTARHRVGEDGGLAGHGRGIESLER
jgi:hypothetical protein